MVNIEAEILGQPHFIARKFRWTNSVLIIGQLFAISLGHDTAFIMAVFVLQKKGRIKYWLSLLFILVKGSRYDPLSVMTPCDNNQNSLDWGVNNKLEHRGLCNKREHRSVRAPLKTFSSAAS